MGKAGRPFTLYTRPRKRGKPVYYVRYRKPGGGWTVAESTGHTSEGAAESYALEQLRTGAVVPTAVEAPTFAQWAVGFWDTGGRYDRARLALGAYQDDQPDRVDLLDCTAAQDQGMRIAGGDVDDGIQIGVGSTEDVASPDGAREDLVGHGRQEIRGWRT